MTVRSHRTPGATYRLQFNKHFTFGEALRWVDYWHALGITDLYASPFLMARPGSIHGYDVVDPRTINPEIGTESDLERLHEALELHGMGLIMDLVPNHMCVNTNDNVWWNDVLENGPSSPFAKFFDIDWKPAKVELRGKVLLPVLGDQYGKVLENGELRLAEADGVLSLHYGERRFPIGLATYPMVLSGAARRLRRQQDRDDTAAKSMDSIIEAALQAPPRSEARAEGVGEKPRESTLVKARLRDLLKESRAARQAVDDELREMNGARGNARSFDRLEALLGQQAYRLSFWRVAAEQINYRRFFEISDLAAVRIEEPEVLETVHAKAFDLVRQGWIRGLRVDHIDGLLQPKGYLDDLRKRADVPYVVVEKILAPGERLPSGWSTEGTTGYEFLTALDGIFVSKDGETLLRAFYDGFRTVRGSFADIAYEARRLILDAAMSSELSVLSRRLDRISEQHRWSRDFTIRTLEQVLAGTIACFPVYRTYVTTEDVHVAPEDAAPIRAAIADAKLRNPHVSASAFDFLGEVLLGQDPESLTDPERAERRDFILRFQELTGPVAAKGVEDTAFFRYFPLLSLNEVGGTPARFGTSVDEFHEQMEERARLHPAALSATSTHDTKRAEDNRARISTISEMPEAWIAAVTEWRELAAPMKTTLNGSAAPDLDDEYYIYQTIVGAWPLGPDGGGSPAFSSRIQGAIEKAIKEAKRHTSWIHPSPGYEEAARTFVSRVLEPNGSVAPRIAAFVAQIRLPGLLNSLSQLAIKITAPGVPDFFQGTELWDLSMVDPDNRRLVDFEKRQGLSRDLQRLSSQGVDAVRELWRDPEDGRIKLFTTSRLLNRRRDEGDLFTLGAYRPLVVEGERTGHVVAFARRWQGRMAITIAGRFFTRLLDEGRRVPPSEAWGDTVVRVPADWAPGDLHDAITGATIFPQAIGVRVASAFDAMPCAVLVGDARGSA